DVQLLIAERGSWKVNQPRFFRPHPTLLGEIARLETRRTNDDRAVGGYIVDVRLGGAWGGVGDRLDAVLGRPVRRERPLVFSNHVSGDDRAIGRSRLRIEAVRQWFDGLGASAQRRDAQQIDERGGDPRQTMT